jgi:hypothetical protein
MYPQIMKYKTWKDKLNGKIRNIENLPAGLKCNYLVLIAGQNDELIAKQWKRVKPELSDNEYLLTW